MSTAADYPPPTIVVMTYNRPHSLARLLKSIEAAQCPAGTQLIISVDGGGPSDVANLAREFAWRHGPKNVRIMDRHLGLMEHTLASGDLALDFGAVVLLEDDVFVSPHFYEFACAALTQYKDEPRLAGLSLYSHRFNETARQPFSPIDDGSDVFFIQLMSWGHIWTATHWQAFRQWYSQDPERVFDDPMIPTDIRRWLNPSWKKHFISYMVESDLFCACPRLSYVTNFADRGVHNHTTLNYLQTELAAGAKSISLPAFDRARAIYDSWCEIVPALLTDVLKPLVGSAEVCIDLYGSKHPGAQSTPYMLTTQRCREALKRFGLRLRPRELNVLNDIAGVDISLAPTDAVVPRSHRIYMPFREYTYGYDHLRSRDLAAAMMGRLIRQIGGVFRSEKPE